MPLYKCRCCGTRHPATSCAANIACSCYGTGTASSCAATQARCRTSLTATPCATDCQLCGKMSTEKLSETATIKRNAHHNANPNNASPNTAAGTACAAAGVAAAAAGAAAGAASTKKGMHKYIKMQPYIHVLYFRLSCAPRPCQSSPG